MKFAIKADSSIATPQEIKLAYMQQGMLPLGNFNDTASLSGTSSLLQLESEIPYVLNESLPLYVKASVAFFLASVILYLMPKRFGKRSDEKNMLKSPLSAATEDSDPWDYSPKKYSDSVKADGVIVVDCDPMRKITNRSRRISSTPNDIFFASNNDNSQDLVHSKNDEYSASIDASIGQYHEYAPPASIENKTYESLVPNATTSEQKETSMQLNTILSNEMGNASDNTVKSEDNSAIDSILSGQKAEPSAEVSKRKVMNVLAMNPVGETYFEAQQHPELNRMDSFKQNENNSKLPSSRSTDESTFQQNMAILRSLSEAETLNPKNQDRPPESFKYYMTEIASPALDDDVIAEKETSSFDVDIVAGKNDSYDSVGVTHIRLAEANNHDKFFYSD